MSVSVSEGLGLGGQMRLELRGRLCPRPGRTCAQCTRMQSDETYYGRCGVFTSDEISNERQARRFVWRSGSRVSFFLREDSKV
eukprot:6186018-Pleurochrysis_carterae.AAC.2